MGLIVLLLVAQSLPDGPNKDLVEAVCTACHDTGRIVSKQMTKAEWADKVLEMLQEDPDVTQPERDKILEYLSVTFPKKVNVNTSDAKQIETGLDVTAKEAAAIVEYRTAKGNFRTLEDLKKVLDPAKVEARKNRVEFQ